MGKSHKREVELVVISDVHLGTYGCHAEELLRYLKTIKPKRLILNGDIIDMWQFSKQYWPKSHMQVVKHITGLLTKNVKVTYLTGNHDEMLRKFSGFRLGSFHIDNKVVLKLNGKRAWIFHGDVFDITMRYSRWIAKLGAIGYDMLILINAFVNWVLIQLGGDKISFSKRIKDSVKSAVKFINDFEKTATQIGIEKGYDYVICGHIHKPCVKQFKAEKGEITYLNSGDWVENLTALEYNEGEWRLYRYHDDKKAKSVKLRKRYMDKYDNDAIFRDLTNQFLTVPK
jgi:UDP-2,3-diacylglucosamine pyrophosphatase LpxH